MYNMDAFSANITLPYHNTIALLIINFIILLHVLGKCYINRKRTTKEQLYVFEILQEIETEIEIITLPNRLYDIEKMMKCQSNYKIS